MTNHRFRVAIAGTTLVLLLPGAAWWKWHRPALTSIGADRLSANDRLELVSLQNSLPGAVVSELQAIEDPNRRLDALRVQHMRRIVEGEDESRPFDDAAWSELEGYARQALARTLACRTTNSAESINADGSTVQWLGLLTRASVRRGTDPLRAASLGSFARDSMAFSRKTGIDPTMHAIALSALWVVHDRQDPDLWPPDDRRAWDEVKSVSLVTDIFTAQRKNLTSLKTTGG